MNKDLDTERGGGSRPGTQPAGLAGRLTAGQSPPPDGRRWTAFALLVATYFITIADFTIVNWVCGLSGLAAVPVAFALIRRRPRS